MLQRVMIQVITTDVMILVVGRECGLEKSHLLLGDFHVAYSPFPPSFVSVLRIL